MITQPRSDNCPCRADCEIVILRKSHGLVLRSQHKTNQQNRLRREGLTNSAHKSTAVIRADKRDMKVRHIEN